MLFSFCVTKDRLSTQWVIWCLDFVSCLPSSPPSPYLPDHDLRYLAFTNLWLLQNISAQIFDWMLTSVCKYFHWHFNDKFRGAGDIERENTVPQAVAVCVLRKMTDMEISLSWSVEIHVHNNVPQFWEYDWHFKSISALILDQANPTVIREGLNYRASCMFRQNIDKLRRRKVHYTGVRTS